jgi:hypothetical protein
MAAPPPWLAAQLAALAAAGVRVSRLRAGGPPGSPADRFAAATPFCGAHVACACARTHAGRACSTNAAADARAPCCVTGEVVLNAERPATPPDVHCASQPAFWPLAPPAGANAEARVGWPDALPGCGC